MPSAVSLQFHSPAATSSVQQGVVPRPPRCAYELGGRVLPRSGGRRYLGRASLSVAKEGSAVVAVVQICPGSMRGEAGMSGAGEEGGKIERKRRRRR